MTKNEIDSQVDSPEEKAALVVAEKFLDKDFANLPLNLSVDPHDTLQESPDVNLWKQLQISNYELIAPFTSAGQMTLEMSVDFANPHIPSKIVYMMVDMDQGNALCFYKGIQDELRSALAKK